jgi:hypothetical protein
LKIGIGSKPGIDTTKKLLVARFRFSHSFRMNYKRFVPGVVAVFTIFLFAGCQTPKEQCRAETPAQPTTVTAAPATPAPVAAPTTAPVAAPAPVVAPTPAATPAPAPVLPPVRIKAGLSAPFTDSEGNVWLPDQGFTDGDTYELSDAQIANTKNPAIYRTERYSMTSFSYPVPNGKYTVKLHFAEIYDGITGPGVRVFSFNVGGQEFKDFDIWVKAGGPNKAYIESVDVEVTDGKLDIAFTPKEENPKINGIEILPRS